MSKPTLSVYMPVPHYFAEREFTVYEALYNAVRYADEVSIVVCKKLYRTMEHALFDWGLIDKAISGYEEKVIWTTNEWEQRMYPIMPAIQYNIALSHCTSDWCFWHDADEVTSPETYAAMRRDIEEFGESSDAFSAFSVGTHHFYGDYYHVRYNDPSGMHDWYDHKPRLFKNNVGIHHNKVGLDIDVLVYPGWDEDVKALGTGRVLPIRSRVHHYGHVRSIDAYIHKKNWIEKTFHRHRAPVIEEYEYVTEGTESFNGIHASIMDGRIACGVDHDAIMEYYGEIVNE